MSTGTLSPTVALVVRLVATGSARVPAAGGCQVPATAQRETRSGPSAPRRELTTTLAPSSHSARAVAMPSPDVEAQTRAVRSASPRSISPPGSAGPFVGVRR